MLKTLLCTLTLFAAMGQAADRLTTIGLPNGYYWNALTVSQRIIFIDKLEEVENISFQGERLSPTEIAQRITRFYADEPANLKVPVMLIKCSVIDAVKGQTAIAAREDRQAWQQAFGLGEAGTQ